jgi:D-alanine-D-alanine ligase
MLSAGIPTAPWVTSREQRGFTPGTYVIKPIAEDASVGLDEDSVVRVQSVAQCQREILRRRKKLCHEMFAERFIEGREFNISIIGTVESPRVLPIAEIQFSGFKERRKPTLVGYRAKWDTESFEYQNTTRSFTISSEDKALYRNLALTAERAWTLTGCRGYARVDLRVNQRGRPFVLEINANPCIAPDAGFIAAANQAGLDYPAVIAELLRFATSSNTG